LLDSRALHSTSRPLADKPTDTDRTADLWAGYRQQADRPDRFTRWMLERTLALLDGRPGCRDIEELIAGALLGPPVPPPKPVDSRVDLLALELCAEQTLRVLAALDETLDEVGGVPLDDLQAKRVNPWGGFREAWLEHYNQVRE